MSDWCPENDGAYRAEMAAHSEFVCQNGCTQRIRELQAEIEEQCRLNGMGAERELALLAHVAAVERRIRELEAEVESWKILAHKSLERIDDAYTHGWADGHHNTGWSGRDEIKRRLELARLEREIASHTVIESFDIGHFQWHRISEKDPDWIIAQYGLLRGLLETHPTEKDLVRLREYGE